LGEALGAWGEAGFSGTIAVTSGGATECVAGYGWADEVEGRRNTGETVFSIGSISKAFTAAAVLTLVDAGELALTDRVGDLMPGLQGPVADATVQQLLLHTSGISGSHGQDHQPLSRDAAVEAIGGLDLAFAPGTDYAYSNAGYTLLAAVVEQVSGTPYRDYLAANVLQGGGFWDGEPAAPGPRAVGVLDSGPTEQMGDFPGPHWALAGNGDLAMTAPQLAAWVQALSDGEIVSPASLDVLTSAGFDHGDGTAETPGWLLFDASKFGQPVLMAAGGGGDIGHNAIVVWLPQDDRVITVMSNTGKVTAEDLMQQVGPALAAGEPVPRPEHPSAEVDPDELRAVAGTYQLDDDGDATFEVTVGDDGVAIAAQGATALTALFPRPADADTHEARVLALLAGETPQGREELGALEDGFGTLADVAVVGTIEADGGPRTYVDATLGEKPTQLWYEVDDHGGVAAAEVAPVPPALTLVPVGDGRFEPDDPTGRGPDVTVTIADGVLTVTGPRGVVAARAR
jgi:CubicO group peptidase (beta-lactamase class C family)